MELTVALSCEYSDKISKFIDRNPLLDASSSKKLKLYIKSGNLSLEALQLLKPFSGDKLGFYLHEMLRDLNKEIILPKYEPPPPNANYVARMEALKARLANEEKMNKFLIVFFNTILTVAGAFAFTYAAVGYTFHGDVFAAQMILGCFVATVVLFADLYFIIRSS
uniref:Transmembrane protein 199 n=1 Tax=Romanomermis culicivorax TaxID=13658 RepID=A0A915K039_ROMCU